MDRNILQDRYVSFHLGQARKSLWIETWCPFHLCNDGIGQARKSLWIETSLIPKNGLGGMGQARKSLWIETEEYVEEAEGEGGQARKSLWIETCHDDLVLFKNQVRLVRACGSKHKVS